MLGSMLPGRAGRRFRGSEKLCRGRLASSQGGGCGCCGCCCCSYLDVVLNVITQGLDGGNVDDSPRFVDHMKAGSARMLRSHGRGHGAAGSNTGQGSCPTAGACGGARRTTSTFEGCCSGRR